MKWFQRPMLVSQNVVQRLSSIYNLGFLFIIFIEVKLKKKNRSGESVVFLMCNLVFNVAMG